MVDCDACDFGIALAQGSMRPDNYTSKTLEQMVTDENASLEIKTEFIDPTEMNIPLPETGRTTRDTERIPQTIGYAKGVIIAMPAHHGSNSSVTKLVSENLGFPSALSEIRGHARGRCLPDRYHQGSRTPAPGLLLKLVPSCLRGRFPWRAISRSTSSETSVCRRRSNLFPGVSRTESRPR